jgi:hypothetical protein
MQFTQCGHAQKAKYVDFTWRVTAAGDPRYVEQTAFSSSPCLIDIEGAANPQLAPQFIYFALHYLEINDGV